MYNLYGLDLVSQDGGGAVRTLLVDGLGSVRQEMVGGAVVAATTYAPYGRVLDRHGTSNTPYGFTGEQHDSATGLLYLRARYYNPQLKTFMSRDPWKGTGWRPETLNYYVYSYNNPTNFSDLSGDRPCSSLSGPCNPTTLPPLVHARVYYLNAIGNRAEGQFTASSSPGFSQAYYIYMAEQAVGEGQVSHIPIYHGSVFHTRIEMGLEMLDLQSHWTEIAADAIIRDIEANPLEPGERLVLLGESGGGTVAVEALSLLKEEGIYVDHLILRGSPVTEWFSNVGRVDYITSRFDYYYSFFIDLDKCQSPVFYQHVLDFWGHVPPNDDTVSEIGNLIFELIIAGSNE